jgi:pantoate--beta-alanine ligase
MGALHEGHMSLVRRSVADNGATVVSIFVNPTQFGPAEDLAKYPRPFEADCRKCEAAGVAIVFAPEAAEMYAKDFSTYVEETRLSRGLCGATRPGHFRGVTTVVAKLFNIVGPDRAYFGQKDAQQAAVIKRMARDLDMGVEIVVMPIVREADGLAMSSRNAYLSAREREEALVLSRGLAEARRLFEGGERRCGALVEAVRKTIAQAPDAKVDYIEAVDAETLEGVEPIRGRTLLALAVFVGKTRLIDNVILEP